MIEDELAHILTTVLLHAVLFLRSTRNKNSGCRRYYPTPYPRSPPKEISLPLSLGSSATECSREYGCHDPAPFLSVGNTRECTRECSGIGRNRSGGQATCPPKCTPVRLSSSNPQGLPARHWLLQLSKHRMGCCWLTKHRRGCSRFSIHRGCCGRLRYWKRQFLSRLWPCNRWQH